MQIKQIRLFELTLNLFTIALISYIGTSVIRKHLESREQRPFVPLSLGHQFPLTTVDWKASPRTVVFALSVGCRFCAASSGFYRTLLSQKPSSTWRSVAVFPQPVKAAKSYMEIEGYSIPEVHEGDLATLGISATPTLLLIDQNGRLLQEWIGQLSSAEERDVATHLGVRLQTDRDEKEGPVEPESRGQSPLVTTEELMSILKSRKPINIIDVRESAQYAHGHITGSINIPLKQLLETNTWRQSLQNRPTIIYCHFSPACQFNGIPSLCSNGTAELRKDNIAAVRVIRDGLPLLEEAGVPITGRADQP